MNTEPTLAEDGWAARMADYADRTRSLYDEDTNVVIDLRDDAHPRVIYHLESVS